MLSYLGVKAARVCGIPGQCTDGSNGSGRQAVGIARSAVSKRPRAVLPLGARPVNRSLPDCRVLAFRPRSVYELSSEAQTVAEGECKSNNTDSWVDCTILEARMLHYRRADFSIGVQSIDHPYESPLRGSRRNSGKGIVVVRSPSSGSRVRFLVCNNCCA